MAGYGVKAACGMGLTNSHLGGSSSQCWGRGPVLGAGPRLGRGPCWGGAPVGAGPSVGGGALLDADRDTGPLSRLSLQRP